MEIIPGFSMPLWSIITIISAAAVLLIYIIIRVFLNYSFLKKCDRAVNNPLKMKEFIKLYSGRKLLKKSRLIEKSSDRNGNAIISDTGLDILWVNQFIELRSTRYLKKIIKYFPEKGLFLCILGGKTKPAFEKIFVKTVSKNSDINLLKKIAVAGDGKDFDGQYAAGLIKDSFQDIVEMTGDSEWQVRYFAIKLLIYNEDERAQRIVWDALADSSSVIRKTVAAEFHPADENRLCDKLRDLLLNDPAYHVRKAARLRLDTDFPEQYRIDTASLTKPQILHLLGLLHDGSDEDENMATEYLLSEDLEIRLQAALYLQKQGVLKKLFVSAELSDKAAYSRIEKLLERACEVNCTDFLKELDNTDNPAAVRLAADLLKKNGNRKYITRLASRIFSDTFSDQAREYYSDIYTESVECICQRGTDDALAKLNNELVKRYKEKPISLIVLPRLPLRGEAVFIPTLIGFLKNNDFPDKQLLRQTIERFPPAMYIEELINNLRTAAENVNAEVKKESFKILGELKMPCCLQMVLENLKLLSNAEQKEFASILNSYDEQAFTDRVTGLLGSCDSEIKASLLSSLPATGLKKFVKDIREAANEPDPEVRIASIWALAGYGETKLISQMTDGLRDPVERVRRETAAVIAEYGSDSALSELKKIITDDNEVMPVKSAAIYGLGKSNRNESINILVDILSDSELRELATTAISEKVSKSEIRQLIELFKDASPQLREYIAEAFKMMGEDCEPAVISLVEEDIASLHETLSEILLKTGYIEATVAKLRHRKPEIRKEAAAVLAMIQTKESFKGMVLAARDPDAEVRVEVLKALEKLNTPEGKPFLEELKEDPDKRVRKYTLWAMERIEAKNLTD